MHVIPLWKSSRQGGSTNMRMVGLTVVDSDRFAELNRWKWRLTAKGYAWRAVRQDGRTRNIFLHNLVLHPPAGFQADHINTNKPDNRRVNLRVATSGQNHANTPKCRAYAGQPTSSRFKGVSWFKETSKWMAQVVVNGKHRYLGLFDDEIQAARAYNMSAAKAFGEFARLNPV